MKTTQRSPVQNCPGIISILAFLVILQGIDNVGVGIWMAITGGLMSHFGSIPISAIFYPLLLIPSRIAQIILSCFTGVLFFLLAWGLGTLKRWAYCIALLVLLPSWMIYDLSKVFLLFSHLLPSRIFEDPDIVDNAVSFIIEAVFFFLLLKKNVKNSFSASIDSTREERCEKRFRGDRRL